MGKSVVWGRMGWGERGGGIVGGRETSLIRWVRLAIIGNTSYDSVTNECDCGLGI